MKRVFLIVLDSFGIGEMPDAAAYGDINVNTLGSVSKSPYFHMENIQLSNILHIQEASKQGKLVMFVGAGVSANSGVPMLENPV